MGSSQQAQAILDALRGLRGAPAHPREIAKVVGSTARDTKKVLIKLHQQGLVRTVGVLWATAAPAPLAILDAIVRSDYIWRVLAALEFVEGERLKPAVYLSALLELVDELLMRVEATREEIANDT